MSKTILSQVDGFTPLPDLLVMKYGVMTAAVFGRMWRYCQMEDGVCRASLDTIAKDLNVNRMTIIRHAEILVIDGFLKDMTPDLKNKPHTYADTGKVAMYNRFGMASTVTKSDSEPQSTITKSDSTVTKSDPHSNKLLLEDSNKKELKKEKDIVDGIIETQLKPKAIQDAMRNHFKLTPNWEAKTNRTFLQWAIGENVMPEQIKLAAEVWGRDKRFNWAHPNLKGIQEHWLQLIESNGYHSDTTFMDELAAKQARVRAEMQGAK